MDLPRLLVLRIWAGPPGFRAVVRELEPARTCSFTDPGALLAFLCGGGYAEAGEGKASTPAPGKRQA